MPKTIAVIGGGIIGLATAYALQERLKDIKIHLFEKEAEIGLHQSGRNSGVLHCGLNYKPGSLKAKLAVEGIRAMTEFCRFHDIPHEICGKVVIASNNEQKAVLQTLANRGSQNGLTGLKMLTSLELKQREPHVRAKEALLVPEEGIVDYKAVMNTLADLIKNNSGEIHYNAEISHVEENKSGGYVIHANNQTWHTDYTVSCAGLHSDRLFSAMSGKKRPLRIIPFRGEYYELHEDAKHIVNHLVYPVPDVRFPFLGVHFTRMIDGSREVGPNAVFAFKREGYTVTDISINDFIDSITYLGFIRFLGKNFSFSMSELSSSLLKSTFISKAKELIPDIDASMIKKGIAGVRAQAISPEGTLLMDFHIERFGNQIHVINAPSPGATASLAIGNYIVDNYFRDFA